ncbi:MAG: molybdopterin-dependent oxidoreductase [Chloroflexi bacterium]|nr:molybdopterin-dependent oxidoreductase [Chloroflexota bacterium]
MQRNLSRRSFLHLPSASDSGAPAIPAETPTEAFYHQHLRHVPPVDPAFWAFSLGGMVQRPLVIRYDELLALPAIELPATLVCIGSTPAKPLIGHARWRGVRLQSLLDQVAPDDRADFAQFYSADGYTTFVERARLAEAILAYEMNGAPLLPEHGYPVRLIVPGLYGYKMPKWIQRLQLTDTPVNGFWEGRGWSASGVAQTLSAIVSPRHLESVSGEVTFTGFAYAGERAVTSVEISIDDAPWMPVPVEAGAPYSWTTWRITWAPPAPGDYLVKVRATDSSGFTQPEDTTAFPNGSTAIQRIIVRVTA